MTKNPPGQKSRKARPLVPGPKFNDFAPEFRVLCAGFYAGTAAVGALEEISPRNPLGGIITLQIPDSAKRTQIKKYLSVI